MRVNSGASNGFFIQDAMTNPSMKVSVETKFLPADSSEEGATYCFSYFVTIENSGDVGAQLIARHWIIEDAKGLHQEVRGLGVVG
ncbi:MAG: ApaG domain, partial [Burkholderiales bacterium]